MTGSSGKSGCLPWSFWRTHIHHTSSYSGYGILVILGFHGYNCLVDPSTSRNDLWPMWGIRDHCRISMDFLQKVRQRHKLTFCGNVWTVVSCTIHQTYPNITKLRAWFNWLSRPSGNEYREVDHWSDLTRARAKTIPSDADRCWQTWPELRLSRFLKPSQVIQCNDEYQLTL